MIDLLIVVLLFASDLISKILAERFLSGAPGVVVVPGFLGLRYVTNTGAAFSILNKSTVFLTVFTFAGLAVIGRLLVKKHWKGLEKVAFLLIFSGGLGNLFDRIFKGYVVDFFEFLFIKFAVFNTADVYVCLGVALYALCAVLEGFSKKGTDGGKNISDG